MKKIYKPTPKQTVELETMMKSVTNKTHYRRLQAVMLRGKGYTVKATAEITGLTPKTITDCTRRYLENGVEELLLERRGGRRHENMTYEEEVIFLSKFDEKIEAGAIITINAMHEAYQKELGRSTYISGFYQMLKRHGWRRIKPRPAHPKKADAEIVDVSKKLTQLSNQ